MYQTKKFISFLFIVFYVSLNILEGQQTPLNPVSYRIFSPFIFNPAIAGSKDFFSVEFLGSKYGESNSQIIAGNTRLSKNQPGYFSSPGIREFSPIGVGGYIFSETDGAARNTGLSVGGSYHLELDNAGLTYLSVGLAAKAIYHNYPGSSEAGDNEYEKFFPNFDAGVYYYSPNLFGGISATNLLGTPSNPDTLSPHIINSSRQLFMLLGYKFYVSKSWNLVIEPSLIFNSDDSFSGEITDMLQPALKVYAGNFCLGTYFNSFDKYSFLIQYKYPRFYIGTYFALPANSAFYKSPIASELTIGINLSAVKSVSTNTNHW